MQLDHARAEFLRDRDETVEAATVRIGARRAMALQAEMIGEAVGVQSDLQHGGSFALRPIRLFVWSHRSPAVWPQPLPYICAATASPSALAAASADMPAVLTNSAITSIIAPRYFCGTIMPWAIERTSVPLAIEV